MQSNINELKTECVRNGLTLENLVTKIGVNSVTLHRKLSGETEFRCNKLQIIQTTSNFNNLSKNTFMLHSTGNAKHCKSLPVVTTVSCSTDASDR